MIQFSREVAKVALSQFQETLMKIYIDHWPLYINLENHTTLI